MNIKMKTLLNVAKGEGYSGKEDAESIKSFLIERGVVKLTVNGQTCEVKALVVTQPDEKTVVVTEDISTTASMEPKDDEESDCKNAADLDAKIKAAVAEATKGFKPKSDGFVIRETPDIKVRSVAEACYENEISTGRAAFKSFERLQAFNDFMLMHLAVNPQVANAKGVQAAKKRLDKGGQWQKKGYATSPDAAGGALLMEQFYPDIINNVLQYGVARKLARVLPMTTDRLIRPVKTGIHTGTYPDENTAGTASTGVSYSKVQLNAKTFMVLMQMSRQVIDDANGSGIGLMDDTMREFARTVAYQEDANMILGDGSATYGNITGINPAFAALTIGSAAGATVGASSFSGHTLANVQTAGAKLPDYARPNAVWLCSPEAQDAIFWRLALASGGVRTDEFTGFGDVQYFRGRPVVTTNVMNSTDAAAANTIDVLYGDFSRGVDFGDRMSLEIDVSDQAYWTSYGIGVRGVVRHDIVVHDIGDTSRRGPIVCLYQS